MQAPEVLPGHEAYPMFWKNLNRFLTVSAVTIVTCLAIRACEQRTHNLLVSSL